ncbi:hypothetical protein OPIT5_25050 [Opitutaceae bacterium TAV5]|nr:hypothetical protein OPIT5_25050 [Opitutaceae bacterium TAV5]
MNLPARAVPVFLFFLLPAAVLAETGADAAPPPAAGATLPAGDAPPAVPAVPDAAAALPAPPAAALSPEERASLFRLAAGSLAKGDTAGAEIAWRRILLGDPSAADEENALLGLARTHRQAGDLVKAAAVYEKLRQDHPASGLLPESCLEHGRVLRVLGAWKLAIDQFYNVIHGTLRIASGQTAHYRQLARTAQFEIAETHYLAGNYADAARFFSRLNLLDLAPGDRARAHFMAAMSRLRENRLEDAATGFTSFIASWPDDESVSEARYQLATIWMRLGRKQDALDVTLDLLRLEHRHAGADVRAWAWWQRRTGTWLANDFYNQGDYSGALTIYHHLVRISPEPRWRLPVLYQIGLCQERLRQTGAARATWRQILDDPALQPQSAGSPPASPPPEDLAELGRMAAWRLEHLDWAEKTGTLLDSLTPPAPDPPLRPSSVASPHAVNPPSRSQPSISANIDT